MLIVCISSALNVLSFALKRFWMTLSYHFINVPISFSPNHVDYFHVIVYKSNAVNLSERMKSLTFSHRIMSDDACISFFFVGCSAHTICAKELENIRNRLNRKCFSGWFRTWKWWWIARCSRIPNSTHSNVNYTFEMRALKYHYQEECAV